MMPQDFLHTFQIAADRTGKFYSLPSLSEATGVSISRLPVSIRIVLESVLRNCDGKRVEWANVEALLRWNAKALAPEEIPFVVARIVLQDFTGVPLLVDLAAMRSAVTRMGKNPKLVEPRVPVDLVVDHSLQVDRFGSNEALGENMKIEFARNRERYEFLKWGQQAFETFRVVPPGTGIIHQVNLEYLAKGVLQRDGVYYPDTLVGTDSHTTMINGLGVVGWGVGGIEAEAGMLGQPVYFLTPEVVGVHLTGKLQAGVTATDLVLRIVEVLRAKKVVGKFVEFFGEGAAALPLATRAMLANMAPEYGATMGFFGIDAETVRYLRDTGRTETAVFEAYYKAQQLWGIPRKGEIDYSDTLEIDLATIEPAVAGPRRPQDRIALSALAPRFAELLAKPLSESGYDNAAAGIEIPLTLADPANPPQNGDCIIKNGSVLIASITSCTNTSDPAVMLAAGLLAKKAVERGLRVNPAVKTSLAPGSRVVTEYLTATGLQKYLDALGFQTVGYACATCIGNSGSLHPAIEDAVVKNNIVAAAVLSGNRNFEARVHQNIRANFLMSPPLVIAFALAGTVTRDLTSEPLGTDTSGRPVVLADIWPTDEEIQALMPAAAAPDAYRRSYAASDQGAVSSDQDSSSPILPSSPSFTTDKSDTSASLWEAIASPVGDVYEWNAASTYIQEPPFFKSNESFQLSGERELEALVTIHGARALGIFGDSVTTDHISPAGAIKPASPAGKYLADNGVASADFNSYGSRRGNDRVMVRGTFANVRIKNLMLPGIEGGYTLYFGSQAVPAPDKAISSSAERVHAHPTTIYDAAMAYRRDGTPLIIIAGHEYGTGSSRDWAAKGTSLLGVRAVVARSFERIHRSNLCGMGILPLQFPENVTAQTLALDGSETFDILGITEALQPRQTLTLRIHRADGATLDQPVLLRIDTPIEVEYCKHGGILPYVLEQIAGSARHQPGLGRVNTK